MNVVDQEWLIISHLKSFEDEWLKKLFYGFTHFCHSKLCDIAYVTYRPADKRLQSLSEENVRNAVYSLKFSGLIS